MVQFQVNFSPLQLFSDTQVISSRCQNLSHCCCGTLQSKNFYEFCLNFDLSENGSSLRSTTTPRQHDSSLLLQRDGTRKREKTTLVHARIAETSHALKPTTELSNFEASTVWTLLPRAVHQVHFIK